MNESIQETIERDPEMADAFRRAQSQQFEHTIFEMWENQLIAEVKATEGEVKLPAYEMLLRTYPWLQYGDIVLYNDLRGELVQEALDTLIGALPKPKQYLYKEVVDDWGKHKQGYMDVIVAFGQLTQIWSERWQAIDVVTDERMKRTLHCALLDVTSLLVDRNEGLTNSIMALQGFEITEAESELIGKRILGVEDEPEPVNVTSESIDV